MRLPPTNANAAATWPNDIKRHHFRGELRLQFACNARSVQGLHLHIQLPLCLPLPLSLPLSVSSAATRFSSAFPSVSDDLQIMSLFVPFLAMAATTTMRPMINWQHLAAADVARSTLHVARCTLPVGSSCLSSCQSGVCQLAC